MQVNTPKILSPRYLIISMVILLSTLSLESMAQRGYAYYQGWNTNIFIGTTNFKGDIKSNKNGILDNSPLSKFFYQDRRIAGGIRLEKHFNNIFSVSGSLMYGKLAGTSDAELLQFQSNILEYNLMTHFYLADLFTSYNRDRKWNAYVFIGIGLTESRTWQYSVLTGDLTGTNGFAAKPGILFAKRPMTETVIPMGFGAKYSVAKNMELTLEYTFHPINTDKLDAFVSDQARFEGFGYVSLGLNMKFSTPKHWSFRRGLPSYTGKSSDPAIKAYNKRKRVVMTNRPQYKRAAKKRHVNKRRKLKRRRIRLSR